MTLKWQLVRNGSSPSPVRACPRVAVVAVANAPVRDLLSALTTVGDSFALATYARSEVAARLDRVLEQLTGPIDRGFLATWRKVNGLTRTVSVHGDLRVSDGRREPAFFGGHGRLLNDVRRWERGELPSEPVQLARLRAYERAAADVIEFPASAAVSNRFGGLELVQPVVLSLRRLREAEATGRVVVDWDPR